MNIKPKGICPYCGWELHKTKNDWVCFMCGMRVRGDKGRCTNTAKQ